MYACTKKIPQILKIIFTFSDQIMDYRERPEFNPSEHGLSPGFRLTNFSKLKG